MIADANETTTTTDGAVNPSHEENDVIATTTTQTTDGAVNPNREERAMTLLDEAKAWFSQTYVTVEDLQEGSWEAEDLVYLARLSVCEDLLPDYGVTYAHIVAEMVGEISYAEEGQEGVDYSGCDEDSTDDECSRCHRSETFTVMSTTDRRLAARLCLELIVAGEMGFNVERDHKGRTSIDFVNASGTAEAEYDEGEAYDDDGVAVYIASQEKARVERAVADAAARQKHRDDLVATLQTRMSTMHPLVQAQAQALIDTIHGDNQHCIVGYDLDRRVARLGVVEGAANGKVYRVSEDPNIGGRRVDHLREGGFIGVVENHSGDRNGREFCLPSEAYDVLMAVRA